MRILCLLLLLFINQETDRTIKGTVMFEDEPMPGVTVTLMNNGDSTHTDQNGEYMFLIPTDIKSVTLEVSYWHKHYGAITRVENIKINSDQITLPNIPFFFGKSIEIKEYNLLPSEEKKLYDPMYHYANVIGYFSRTQIDTAQIRFPCNRQLLKLPYTHVPQGNKVIFNFKDLSACQ